MPEKLHIPFYEYVEDARTARPHREGHLGPLALARRRPHRHGSGVGVRRTRDIVLREDDLDAAKAAADEFVAEDPYQPAGLVTSWRVEPFLNVTA